MCQRWRRGESLPPTVRIAARQAHSAPRASCVYRQGSGKRERQVSCSSAEALVTRTAARRIAATEFAQAASYSEEVAIVAGFVKAREQCKKLLNEMPCVLFVYHEVSAATASMTGSVRVLYAR